MEDHKEELILILAGYRQEMNEFLAVNPGLQSRFPVQLDFPDFTKYELITIAEAMCSKRQYQLTTAAKLALSNQLTLRQREELDRFGNARAVRNIIELAIRRQALRLFRQPTVSRYELQLLEPEDFLTNNQPISQKGKDITFLQRS